MHGSQEAPSGYAYGRTSPSPVSLEELRQLEAAASFADMDRDALAKAGRILAPQAEALVDAWRARIAAQPHLVKWFLGPDGKPDEDYKAKVKARFVRWVKDLCERPFDQDWLDYQHEIGLRHTPAKKNLTDRAHTPPLVPLRFLLVFTAEIILVPRRYLLAAAPDEADRLHAAWTKAVLLTIALWSEPYAREGLW